jgi:spore germination protein YaaH
MTYDYDLGKTPPTPTAPLSWVKQVLNFTQSQGVNMSKVLLGIPYYGRNWSLSASSTPDAPKYDRSSVSLAMARDLMTKYSATPQRVTSSVDPVGTPSFTYTDENQVVHNVYYEDPTSWGAKLNLLDEYHLGGAAAWSLNWVNADTAKELYPLLQQHLR